MITEIKRRARIMSVKSIKFLSSTLNVFVLSRPLVLKIKRDSIVLP